MKIIILFSLTILPYVLGKLFPIEEKYPLLVSQKHLKMIKIIPKMQILREKSHHRDHHGHIHNIWEIRRQNWSI